MIFFIFSSVYLVPITSFLFVILLLKAIGKIVNKERYTLEMFWSALLFAITMWSISIAAAVDN